MTQWGTMSVIRCCSRLPVTSCSRSLLNGGWPSAHSDLRQRSGARILPGKYLAVGFSATLCSPAGAVAPNMPTMGLNGRNLQQHEPDRATPEKRRETKIPEAMCSVINTEEYPIDRPGSPEYEQLVQRAAMVLQPVRKKVRRSNSAKP